MIYTLTLSPAIDYNMYIDNIKIDEINKSNFESFHAGGKGINVSLVLKELGINSTCLGFLGGFTGKFIDEYLRSVGLNTDFVWTENNTRINVKISANSGETAIDGMGPIIKEKLIDELKAKINSLKKGDYLVLSGNTCANVSDTIYEEILSNLDKDVVFVVDSVRYLLLSSLKYKPLFVKPNIFEIEEALKITINDDNDIINSAKKLQEMGARNVVISLGERGLFVLDETGKSQFITIPEELKKSKKVVNTIGCGDSTVAGIIAKYLETTNMIEASKYGVACGTASAYSEHFGKKDEIENIYKLIN